MEISFSKPNFFCSYCNEKFPLLGKDAVSAFRTHASTQRHIEAVRNIGLQKRNKMQVSNSKNYINLDAEKLTVSEDIHAESASVSRRLHLENTLGNICNREILYSTVENKISHQQNINENEFVSPNRLSSWENMKNDVDSTVMNNFKTDNISQQDTQIPTNLSISDLSNRKLESIKTFVSERLQQKSTNNSDVNCSRIRDNAQQDYHFALNPVNFNPSFDLITESRFPNHLNVYNLNREDDALIQNDHTETLDLCGFMSKSSSVNELPHHENEKKSVDNFAQKIFEQQGNRNFLSNRKEFIYKKRSESVKPLFSNGKIEQEEMRVNVNNYSKLGDEMKLSNNVLNSKSAKSFDKRRTLQSMNGLLYSKELNMNTSKLSKCTLNSKNQSCEVSTLYGSELKECNDREKKNPQTRVRNNLSFRGFCGNDTESMGRIHKSSSMADKWIQRKGNMKYCVLCSVLIPNDNNLYDHMRGSHHRSNLKNIFQDNQCLPESKNETKDVEIRIASADIQKIYLSSPETCLAYFLNKACIFKLYSKYYKCGLCSIRLNENYLYQHISDKEHVSRVNKIIGQCNRQTVSFEVSILPFSETYSKCFLCDILLPKYHSHNYNIHLHTTSHQKNMWNHFQSPRFENWEKGIILRNGQPYCVFCCLFLHTDFSMEAHLTDPAHRCKL